MLSIMKKIQTLTQILTEAGIATDGISVAVMPRRIRTAMRETYFYGTNQPVRLAEISIRDDEEHFLCIRMYLDIVREGSSRPFIPVICLGPRHVLEKLAKREGLTVQSYDGIIHVEDCEFLVLKSGLLHQLRGFTQVLNQSDLVVVQRKSSFRLTGIQSCVIRNQPAILKHYDNLINPQEGDFFLHILSHSETEPLVSHSEIGEVPGICVTNSRWYVSQHPELQFVQLQKS